MKNTLLYWDTQGHNNMCVLHVSPACVCLLPACVTYFLDSDWSKYECFFLKEVIEVDKLYEENETNKGRLSFATLKLLLPELIRP